MKYLIRYMPPFKNARNLYYGGFINDNPTWYASPKYAIGFDTYSDSRHALELLSGFMRMSTKFFDICT